jgi:hypothetical protein
VQWLLEQGQVDCSAAATAFLQCFSSLDSARETLLAFGGAETVAGATASAGAEHCGVGASASAVDLRFRDPATGRCMSRQICAPW